MQNGKENWQLDPKCKTHELRKFTIGIQSAKCRIVRKLTKWNPKCKTHEPRKLTIGIQSAKHNQVRKLTIGTKNTKCIR